MVQNKISLFWNYSFDSQAISTKFCNHSSLVIIGHGLEPPDVHPPPPPPTKHKTVQLNHTNFVLNLDMSKTWNEMLTAQK